MRNLLTRRRPADIVLDLLFFSWLLSIMATGHLLPITTLLPHERPVSVYIEQPISAPNAPLPADLQEAIVPAPET